MRSDRLLRGTSPLFTPSPAAIRRALLAGWCLLAVFSGPFAQAGVSRVMPLGDSITVGVGDATNGGYRGPLYQRLASSGCGADFVGNQGGGAITDPNHEGHSGWRAEQIRDNIAGWLAANPADIVLLHIGTNDISMGEKAAGITTEIGQILDLIDAYESGSHVAITVILARIINRSTPQSALGIETSTLNASIASMAAARIAAGDHLVVVDHESALSYPGDLADTVHPNASGYGKMATVWFNALNPLLRNKGDFVSDTIPAVMFPGVSYDCGITMKNSGCQSWLCSPAGTQLTVGQANGPVPNKLIPYPYYAIYTSPCQIDSGQNATFPFSIEVPADTPLGAYEIRWQMKDNNEWFNSNGHEAVFRKTVAVRLYPPYQGDSDDDGDVDQDDFGWLQACFAQPGNPACSGADLNADGRIDALDTGMFRMCMSGSGILPPPDCIKSLAPRPVFPKPVFAKPVFPKLVFPKPVFPRPVFPRPVFPRPVFPRPVWDRLPAGRIPPFPLARE